LIDLFSFSLILFATSWTYLFFQHIIPKTIERAATITPTIAPALTTAD